MFYLKDMNKEFIRPISLFNVHTSYSVISQLTNTFHSGYLSQGKKVDEFEDKLADFLGNDQVVTVNSCTSAIFLALHLLKTPAPDCGWPGFDTERDTVLTTALTCTATNWPILHNGMKLRWVDTDLGTCNLDLSDLASKMNANTKIIIVMHWGGYPVNLDTIQLLQNQHQERYGYRPVVIQDAAHAFGAEWNNKKIGNKSLGDITCFSFQAIKLLTTGDGGCLTFGQNGSGNSKFLQKLYKRAKLLRWYGIDREKRSPEKESKSLDFRLEADVPEAGFKMHMNDINATIGLANIVDVPKLISMNRKNAELFKQKLPKEIQLQCHSNWGESTRRNTRKSSYWLFSIAVENKTDFMQKLKEKGIMTSQVHKRNDSHSCVAEFKEPLPNLDELEKKLVCIPVGYWLSESDLDFIIHQIILFAKAEGGLV